MEEYTIKDYIHDISSIFNCHILIFFGIVILIPVVIILVEMLIENDAKLLKNIGRTILNIFVFFVAFSIGCIDYLWETFLNLCKRKKKND